MDPYTNISESETEVVRLFNENVDPIELKWHRDREDRLVESLEPTDWMIQMDNHLPSKIDKVFIPAGEWHRVIKGTGDLVIKIQKT
jgi:hypothetical protein